MSGKLFALIGAAGYIAPRHMEAIKESGNTLAAALDRHDSVGIIDRYFPEASFFTEFERFDRHLEKLKRLGKKIDYVVICSPNYLHDAHIRFALRYGADVICEKPLVLNPWNIDAIQQMENETGRRVFNILQLRHHKNMLDLKKMVDSRDKEKVYDVDLTYITSRGNWYYASWKGDLEKSGGIATNIGIHFFDVLGWIFGEVIESSVHIRTHDRAAGVIKYRRARVRWFLSINAETLPEKIKNRGITTYRTLIVDNNEIDISNGFENLHLASYQNILQGIGFGTEDCKNAVRTVYEIRHAQPTGLTGNFHPLAKLPLSNHPFQGN